MKIRSRWLTRCLAWLVVRTCQLLFRTCRIEYLAPEPWLRLDHPPAPGDARRCIMCVWHDVLLIPTIAVGAGVRRQTCSLVSKHQDGSYLADAMDFLGYSTVRGSTKRGGAAAVKQLLEDTAGMHIVLTPDGPRGPRREMKLGAIFVASQTGRPLCPGAFACTRFWSIPGSWTNLVIPKPFSTVYLVTGTPMVIPENLDRAQLEHYQQAVQAAMNHLGDQVERLARGEISELDFAGPQDLPNRQAA